MLIERGLWLFINDWALQGRGFKTLLQVLDGVTVSHGMRLAADEAFRGRLMANTLARRLGHSSFQLLHHLDLSGMQLLSLGEVFASHTFPSLSHVSLDGNSLSQVRNWLPVGCCGDHHTAYSSGY